MKIRRRHIWNTTLWVYEAVEGGYVIAKALSKSELRQKLRAVDAARKTDFPGNSSEKTA